MAKSEHTPGPWTTDAGRHRMWICQVGNNPDDPEVWSMHETPVGQPWPFGDKVADARLIAAAPDLKAFADAILIYQIEGEDVVRMRFMDRDVCAVRANSALGAQLLKLEACRSAAIAKATDSTVKNQQPAAID